MKKCNDLLICLTNKTVCILCSKVSIETTDFVLSCLYIVNVRILLVALRQIGRTWP